MKKVFRISFVLLCVLLMLCGCTGGKKEEDKTIDISGKTFYNTVDNYDNNDHSKIWFGKDKTFVLKDNFYDGYYEADGTWEINENVVTLKVEHTGVGQFEVIKFEIKDEDTLILKTSLAGSQSDDVFSTTEVKGPTNGGSTTVPDLSFKYNTYYNMTQSSKNKSYVEIRSDNSFAMLDMDDFGVMEANGTCTISGDTLTCGNFQQVNPFGESVKEIYFMVFDENTLILLTDLGVSRIGDVFSSNGTIPAELGGSVSTVATDKGGLWIHSPIEDVNPMYYPQVEFDAAGKFVFTENCYAGMGTYEGTYEKKDSGYTCHVEKTTMQGFKGDDVTVIEFEKKDDKTLVLKTELCMSMIGDTFELQ